VEFDSTGEKEEEQLVEESEARIQDPEWIKLTDS
jgi:hypothetical protein